MFDKTDTIKVFLSVGSRFPMSRLVQAMDTVIGNGGPYQCVAQAGESSFQPRHLTLKEWMSDDDFKAHAQCADVIVSHAGMGNILLALELGKPIIVMPRSASLNEHINDHQHDTVNGLASQDHILVVHNEEELAAALLSLSALSAAEGSHIRQPVVSSNRTQLLNKLSHYLGQQL